MKHVGAANPTLMTDNPNSGFETLARSQPLRVGFLPLNDCAPLVMARNSVRK